MLCKGLLCSESRPGFALKSQSAHRAQGTLQEGLRGAFCLREGGAPLRQDRRGEKGTLVWSWEGRVHEAIRVGSSCCPAGDPRAFPALRQATRGGRKCSLLQEPRCSGMHLPPPPGPGGLAPGPPSTLGDKGEPLRNTSHPPGCTAQTLQLFRSKTLFSQLENGGDNTHLLGRLKGEMRPYM